MVHPPSVHRLLVIALTIACATLSGCSKPADAPPAAVAASPAPAPAPLAAAPAPATSPYTQPTADQLYRMVAPIALYPDKLVAQVLAAATYPAQVADADRWLRQNPGLQAGPLADAADGQTWDPSVKSLTAFRSVLDQLTNNLPWTTALGEAYYHDPSDVMNAIQAMRQRASRAGRLKSTPQLKVASGSPSIRALPNGNLPWAPSSPAVVAPPAQYITIAPAQPDTVYVPAYDPERMYGEPVRVYPGYVYAPPQPVYSAPHYGNAQVATVGALTFGLGVVVGSALERHDWGWHAWSMDWGARRPPPGRDGGEGRRYAQPAVVYNRTTYISHSQTVSNNVHNTYNVYNDAPAPREAQPRPAQAPAQVPLAQTVQLQHDPAAAERMQQQQRQMQVQQAQARQQQQQQQERARQQEQARQEQARDQQMRAQQQRIDQARQAQEQGREQQVQRQQQQQLQAQQQGRLQQEQRQQQQERQREQQEQARQMQEHARQAQEQQRRQAEEQGRQRQQVQQHQQPPHNEPQAHPHAEPPRRAQEAPAQTRPQPPHGAERQREPSPTNGRT